MSSAENIHIKHLISEGKILEVVNIIAESEPFEIDYDFFKIPNPVPIAIVYLKKRKEETKKLLKFSEDNKLEHLRMFLLVLG